MKVDDLISICSKYPALYNSVSNFIFKKFGVQSAEVTLISTYITYTYIQCILRHKRDICSWDLEDSEIIYVKDILQLFNMKGE